MTQETDFFYRTFIKENARLHRNLFSFVPIMLNYLLWERHERQELQELGEEVVA